MRLVAEPEVPSIIDDDLSQFRAAQVRLLHRFGGLLDLGFVSEPPSDARKPLLLKQPLAGELVNRHPMIRRVMPHELQLLQSVNLPRLIAELAMVALADRGVELYDILEDAAVVVHAGQHARAGGNR